MKKLFTLLVLAITLIATAQAPQGFNYQATVRNSAGALITNQNVLFKFNIMQNSQTSLPVYSETHQAPTDDLGQVNLIIGTGTANTTGSFSTINWGTGNYYLSIELNTGAGYVAMGTTQLLSVPYALYANSAGNSQAATPNLADPSDAQDAVTKSYSDVQLQTQVSLLQAQISAIQNAIVAPLPNVTIGTQIWSSTNLDVTTYRDGTPIPKVTDPTAWANLTTGAWCYYNNDPANGAVYGKLYNWYAVAGIYNTASLANPALRKQFAPTGWHVPTDDEWRILINYLDPNANGGATTPNIAGGKMKATGTLQSGTGLWQYPNTAATNTSGFTALPSGNSYTVSTFGNIGFGGNWWSFSSLDTTYAWDYYLDFDVSDIVRNYDGKRNGFSVRCLRD